MTVAINCDMGEAFGIYRMGDDEACMPYITHANVACGFHASDPMVMWRTIRAAKRHGVKVGSHPGLPDREGFGRREMQLSRPEVAALVLYQTGALQAFLTAEGLTMSHIKPHGALFGMAQKEETVAEGIADAALALNLAVIGYANGAMSTVFSRRGVAFTCEFYADLDYDDSGRQVITMTHDPISPAVSVAKVLRAVRDGKTRSLSGKEIDVVAETICVHSDTPGALEVAMAVHAALSCRAPDVGRSSKFCKRMAWQWRTLYGISNCRISRRTVSFAALVGTRQSIHELQSLRDRRPCPRQMSNSVASASDLAPLPQSMAWI